MVAKTSVFGIAAIAACVVCAPALAAGQYEFLAAPQINLSLVYRLDKLTGDVIACQFAHNPGRTDVGPGRVWRHLLLSRRRRGDQAGAWRLWAHRHPP